MNHDDDELDFGFEDLFDEEPPAEEAVTTAAAVAAEPAEPEPAEPAEPGPSVGVTRTGKGKAKAKAKKGPIIAGVAGAVSIEEYKARQTKLQSALAEKNHLAKQRKLSASEYVHQMRACFNGFTVLPLSAGEKIERFLTGLNPELHRLVVTAPQGLGVNGKWLDPNSLMSYAVQQSQALAGGGGKDASATYLQVAANGFKKRPTSMCGRFLKPFAATCR
ncbi:TPA: hypothetical protein ACH3X1_006660 [Trebouxia sp. C0004]